MIPPRIPSTEDLQPLLDKLEANPGSMILLAIEWPRQSQNFAQVGTGWFDSDARARLRRALFAEKRREAKP